MVQHKLGGLICLGALVSAMGCADDTSTTEDEVSMSEDADAGGEETDEASEEATDESSESDETSGDEASTSEDDAETDVRESDTVSEEEPATDAEEEPATSTTDEGPAATTDEGGEMTEPDPAAEGTDPDVEVVAEMDAGVPVEPEPEPEPAMEADAGGVEVVGEECPAGYIGSDCSECARGYADDGEGNCLESCLLLDCGSHGVCEVADDLAVACACDLGWGGDDCSECAPGYRSVRGTDGLACSLDTPSTETMVVWLDADDDDSFALADGSKVYRWYSRAGAATYFSDGGDSSARPTRFSPTRGGRRWVRFDGENDKLRRLVDLSSGSYSIFMVAKASADVASTQTLLSGVDPESGDHGLRLQIRDNGQELLLRHQMPFGADYDQVLLPEFDLTQAKIVHAERTTDLFNALSLWDGDSLQPVPSTTAAFGGQILLQLGSQQNGGSDYALDGDVAELIIFSPALADAAEYEDVRNYLDAKWNL